MNMNKDIKKLVTTLQKGCRRFLRIDEDQETTLHLMEQLQERQSSLWEMLNRIESNNVVFHKTTLSSRVKALIGEVEIQIEGLDSEIYDIKNYIDDVDNALENHINYDEHIDSDDISDIVSDKLSNCTVEVEASINT